MQNRNLIVLNLSNQRPYIEKAKGIYEKYSDKIILPEDLAQVVDGKREEALADSIPADFNAIDIGTGTANLYREIIMKARTAFANGPVGVFEQAPSEYGTKVLFEGMAETPAYTVVGGGDSVTAAKKYGVTDKLGYICTGSGALIRFLTGEELPVVKALRHARGNHPSGGGGRPAHLPRKHRVALLCRVLRRREGHHSRRLHAAAGWEITRGEVIMDYAKESLRLHGEWKGKIEVIATVPVKTKEDLSPAYIPGVAQPCLEIQKNIDKSYELTRRWNM